MDLKRRATKLAGPQAPETLPAATEYTLLLACFERNESAHTWMRCITCALAFLCYTLAMFQIDNFVGNTVIHVLMLLLSLGGIALTYFVYGIKRHFTGTRRFRAITPPVFSVYNPLLADSSQMLWMLLEIVIWLLQCPPGVRSRQWINSLDSLVILRFYVFPLCFARFVHSGTFARAITTLCNLRVDVRLVWRSSRHRYLPVTIVAFLVFFVSLATLYSNGESLGFLDSVYFCIATASLSGYGDYAPRTFSGRFSAVLAWVLGLVFFVWLVGVFMDAIDLTLPERNLYNLFRTNKLCAKMPGEAARTIQRAWKLYAATKAKRSALIRQFHAILLNRQVIQFRHLRREFGSYERAFRLSTQTFQEYLSSTHDTHTAAAPAPESPAPLGHPSTASSSDDSERTPSITRRSTTAEVSADTTDRLKCLEASFDKLLEQARRLTSQATYVENS